MKDGGIANERENLSSMHQDVEISIRDEELIAGNRTVKPRAGIMSPEMDPYWLLKELDQFPTRPQVRFAISEEDKRCLLYTSRCV